MAISDDLTAWYRAFDNTDSTGSLDLVLQNNASTSSAGDNKCGSYFVFPDSPLVASYLQVSSSIAPDIIRFESDQGFTFSTWAYNIHPSAHETFLLKLNGFHVPWKILANGNIAFSQDCFGVSTADSGYDLRGAIGGSGNWHHLAMVLSGSSAGGITPTAKYYLDGAPVAIITLNAGCNPIAGNSNVGVGYIGNEETGAGYYKSFERLTDIAFWNRPLSDAEIGEVASGCLYDILFPSTSGDVDLFSSFTEVAWIYDGSIYSSGSPSSGAGSLPPLIQPSSGGPMIGSDYVINSFKALSSERLRRVEQVPFRLARKDRLGVRRLGESTAPPAPPVDDDIELYSNFVEVAWISGSFSFPSGTAFAPAPPPPAPMAMKASGQILFGNIEVLAEAERAPMQGEVEFHALEVLVEADRTPMQGEVEFHALEVLVEADRTPMQGEIEFHGLEVLIEADRTPMQANLEFSGLEITVEAERVTPEVGSIIFSNLEIVVEAAPL